MKTFSVAFRDKLTGRLYGGVVDQEELTKLVNNENIQVCACHEIWRG